MALRIAAWLQGERLRHDGLVFHLPDLLCHVLVGGGPHGAGGERGVEEQHGARHDGRGCPVPLALPGHLHQLQPALHDLGARAGDAPAAQRGQRRLRGGRLARGRAEQQPRLIHAAAGQQGVGTLRRHRARVGDGGRGRIRQVSAIAARRVSAGCRLDVFYAHVHVPAVGQQALPALLLGVPAQQLHSLAIEARKLLQLAEDCLRTGSWPAGFTCLCQRWLSCILRVSCVADGHPITNSLLATW
mmetsp:Transcript_94548/g.276277  ORF Transcript_94548/g.276277 Transcript_94548/m.276277 type:complete len:244 (-) Transcript_94548:35-766(-)